LNVIVCLLFEDEPLEKQKVFTLDSSKFHVRDIDENDGKDKFENINVNRRNIQSLKYRANRKKD
jgi:hypothetical protein